MKESENMKKNEINIFFVIVILNYTNKDPNESELVDLFFLHLWASQKKAFKWLVSIQRIYFRNCS